MSVVRVIFYGLLSGSTGVILLLLSSFLVLLSIVTAFLGLVLLMGLWWVLWGSTCCLLAASLCSWLSSPVGIHASCLAIWVLCEFCLGCWFSSSLRSTFLPFRLILTTGLLVSLSSSWFSLVATRYGRSSLPLLLSRDLWFYCAFRLS